MRTEPGRRLHRGFVGACVVAVAIATATGAHAAEPEALALSLQTDEGAACLSAEALASALAARVGTPISIAAGDATLAVSVTARTTGPRRFAVVIESHDRANDSSGRRELAIDDACEALTAPISLVIALMIGTQTATATSAPSPADAPPAPVPVPEPAAPPTPAPAPPPVVTANPTPAAPASSVTGHAPSDSGSASTTDFALGVGGGADLGLLPDHTPVVQLSGRVRWMPPPSSERGLPLLAELALELWPPLTLERDGAEITVAGMTLGSALCSAWSYGVLSFEPCAGLWLRPLHASAPTAFDAKWFLLGGWSARTTFRFALAASWSIFVGAQAVLPFGLPRLVLEPSPPKASREGPFFNSPEEPPPRRRLTLHEVPSVGGVLIAGLTLAL